MALSRPLKEDRLSAYTLPMPLSVPLSPPGDRWRDVLGFVLAGSVSRSSTLQIFRDAIRLRRLLSPPVYLLCHFLLNS